MTRPRVARAERGILAGLQPEPASVAPQIAPAASRRRTVGEILGPEAFEAEIKRATGSGRGFVSFNTSLNQPVGIAFPHGAYLVMLVRTMDLQLARRFIGYPRAGLDIMSLPPLMNLRDPMTGSKWTWRGQLWRDGESRFMRGSLSSIPTTLWIPDRGPHAGKISHGGYKLIAMSPPQEEAALPEEAQATGGEEGSKPE